MSIHSPARHWWRSPLHAEEKIWITIALVWCILITLIMPAWHIIGEQNPPQEYYRITTDDFYSLTDKFIDKYKTGEEEGIPVVEPPPNSDAFMRAAQWSWDPILKLKAGQTYRLHLSSVDVNHGFSIYPLNMNFQAVPGWDSVLTITPTKAGEYTIICNEFCGIGHHLMFGKIYVE